jgi:hypothetical protein
MYRIVPYCNVSSYTALATLHTDGVQHTHLIISKYYISSYSSLAEPKSERFTVLRNHDVQHTSYYQLVVYHPVLYSLCRTNISTNMMDNQPINDSRHEQWLVKY